MAEAERSTKAQNLILENRKRLSVSGVEEVSGFDETFVRLRTVLGELTVYGEELRVEELSVESGELMVSGNVAALEYGETAPKRRPLSRLFGRG